ncbi:hypothetical protein ACHAW5_001493 [Stephanodiscus triporus]|uniref:DUF6824 domain-containing protein n=1 Tax=Stephanodiscus triporus TaxID=2934178 RepID=A0ABD3N2X2_9STRA
MSCPPCNNACAAGQHPQEQPPSRPIVTPTSFDVIGGRGQGVQRLPGNRKYRALVSVNKRIYASCHRNDKRKICKAIVAAIRNYGGRFLEYDERSRTYHDIGDERAWGKTSQALREGLAEIRQQLYSDMAEGRLQSVLDKICLGSSNDPVPVKWYFEYSVRKLQSLSKHDEDAAS